MGLIMDVPGVNVTADLRASLLKVAIEDCGLASGREAERLARLCVSLRDDVIYDAAVWQGAEGIYRLMSAEGESRALDQQPIKPRKRYLDLAVDCIARYRLTLEGGFGVRETGQAYAAYYNHKVELGEAVAARRRQTMALVESGR